MDTRRMFMKDYKGAVFFDFDGTLVDEKADIYVPTETTKKSIAALKENDYMTCLATGRAMCYIPETQIEFDCYITSNGSCATVDGEYVINDIMETNELIELIDFFDKNGYGYIVENDRECFYSKTNQESFIKMMNNFNIDMSCFFPFPDDIASVAANKMMFTYNGDRAYAEFIGRFGDKYNITRHRSNPSGDLVKKKINKAFGINAVIKAYSLELSDTYAFGDGENDYEMIEAVGNGIVMGKHAAPLEGIADHITDTVINEGVTLGLKHYGLI